MDKERIKLKGNRQKIIVPIHPSQGKPQTEPTDDDADTQQLYQITNNEYYSKPNTHGKIHLKNLESIGYNSDTKLYDSQIENYELQAQDYWTIESNPKRKKDSDFPSLASQKKIKEKLESIQPWHPQK